MTDPVLKHADRLRSCFVAGMGFAFGAGLSAWTPGVTGQGAVGPAVFWIGLALAAIAWGLWRYLVLPLRGLAAVEGRAGAARLAGRVAVVCLPYGLVCGLLLAPLGADAPIEVQALILLALIWGWDAMKAHSQRALAVAVSRPVRAVP
ncbi:MAG: hypothetical protein KDK24_19970 [Pseudooceanicola sp.]|nr:hypothetical protein [Pseudooceanicola sp.]